MSNSNKNLTLFVLMTVIMLISSAQNECSINDQQFLVTFHPHLDAFWLNTDDELKNINFRPAGFLYSMNQRNSKQIFNSMLQALLKNQTRKYFITQIVFFKDWYQYISAQQKQQVRNLIKNNQLQITNSGWVQNDQAVCYYEDILDQYTIGMNWMYEQFGYINRIGWATDSFGHSHSQVALQHLLGFQFQGIERIDDRYIYQRKQHPLLEFYWQPISDSNGRKYGGLLNHVRHFLHEVNDLRRISPSEVTRDFKALKTNMKNLYNKNKFFRFLGNDFEQFITSQFQTLQRSFTQLNSQNKQCQPFRYGNPTDYLNLLKPYWKKNKLQTRKFDLMTNWDQDRYWSGYFTTDPQLKIICKAFSRLFNLAKKRLVKGFLVDNTIQDTHGKILTKAEQLVSIMQHHDGITATSKAHIEKLFKQRMNNSSKQLIEAIKKVQNINSQQICQLFKNKNSCKITAKKQSVKFTILHEGIKKTQKIQLTLPQNWGYQVQGIESFIIVNNDTNTHQLVFLVQLNPGVNHFNLKGGQLSSFSGKTFEYKQYDNEYNLQGIGMKVQGNIIVYKFGYNEMKFSFQTSVNSVSRRQTVAWNKYGNRQDKSQGVIPGIYIMSNNGILQQMNIQIKNFSSVSFGMFHRFCFTSENKKLQIFITVKKNHPSQVQYDFKFSPFGYSMVDYFLKVQSNVINKNNQFYHDSNGYLVSKRKIGFRPDYNWEYKNQDKINANTYPACSFFYQVNDKNQKFIAFLDRAVGVTTYDGAMLINIDRLAQDDYKGVGQSYTWIRQNNFKFKFAVAGLKDDLQRIWQRSYDDSLIGFFSQPDNLNKFIEPVRESPDHSIQYMKYSLSFLNNQQILLRIHNLGERTNLKLNHYNTKQWNIDQLNLKLKYQDIRQSFANGLMFKQRYNWINDNQEISHLTRGKNDTTNQIVIRPLQIRSFRINLKRKIIDKQTNMQTYQSQVNEISVIGSKPLIKQSLRKRCFE